MANDRLARAIGVVRVSGPGQRDKYGPASQLQEITNRARLLQADLVDVWEYQESATNSEKRPQFEVMLQRMVSMGQARELAVVIFGRPDRLGRDGEAAFFYYLHLLEQIGQLQVRFARDDVDPNDSFRNFKLFLHAFKAKQDADTIRENTMRGRQRRGEAGKIPNGQVPWPFDYDTKRELGDKSTGLPRINLKRAAWIRRWADWLLAEKVSLGELGRRMFDAGIRSPRGTLHWPPSTVKRILSNRALLGEFYAFERRGSRKLVHKDQELAILTPEEFASVQNILAENRVHSVRNTKRDYTPLHGFVWCHCGRKAAACPQKGKPYFRCNHCRDHVVSAHKLWAAAKRQLSELLATPEQVLPTLMEHLKSGANRAQLENRHREISIELRELESAFERAIRMFAILEGYGEERIRDEVDRIKRRQKTLSHDLEEVERGLNVDKRTKLSAKRLKEICERLAGILDEANAGEWKNLLREFGFKLVLQKDPPHIMRLSVEVEQSPSAVLQPS